MKLIFYRTWAHYDVSAAAWRLPIHGYAFVPEAKKLRKKAAQRIFRHLLKRESAEEQSELFNRRAAPFFVGTKRGERFAIRLGEGIYDLAPTRANGHTETELKLTDADARSLLEKQNATGGWLSFRAEVRDDDGQEFSGQVQLLEARGLSIVSDIDDTIKVTEVTRRRRMLRNTFLRPFEAVRGMGDLYQAWQAAGTSFHYVSATPWQLFDPLCCWFPEAGFPAGSFDLRMFRLKDRTGLKLFRKPVEFKRRSIERMLTAFPQRRFILVGDSGSHDPEIYGRLAHGFPESVLQVLIRNVTDESAKCSRYQKAFAELPRHVWQIFDEPGEISLNTTQVDK